MVGNKTVYDGKAFQCMIVAGKKVVFIIVGRGGDLFIYLGF